MPNYMLASVHSSSAVSLPTALQEQSVLQHLWNIAERSLRGELEETIGYAVFTEELCAHKRHFPISTSPIIFPQIRLLWDSAQPHRRKRSALPDLGIGRISDAGAVQLLGGVEQKAAIEQMRGYPHPDAIREETDARTSFNRAAIQARDQIRTAVRAGALPNNMSIAWIVAVGPYFMFRNFDIFTPDELNTRFTPRPNDSGDYADTARTYNDWLCAAETELSGPIYRIGTNTASAAISNYIEAGSILYNGTRN